MNSAKSDSAELVVPPMLEQAGGLGGHLPLALVWYMSPPLDLSANSVDDCRVLVLLLLR